MARERPMAGRQIFRSVLCFSGVLLLTGSRAAAAQEIVPGLMERDMVLEPSSPTQVKVAIGQAKFLNFKCNGGPADVVISLSTYAERADPLLFLSLDPAVTPSFKSHDASSFGQWREDAAGDHYVIAKAVSPQGGILGLVNMRHFAGEELDGILSIHCTFIVAFDTLFWDHLRSSAVCPWGRSMQDPSQQDFCSGNGECTQHGVCSCDGDHVGPACEHQKSDMVVAAEGKYRFKVATGRYQYFRVRVPPRFEGGFLEVRTMSEQPLVVLVRGDDLPTKTNFELSNFDDWVNAQNTSVLKYKVDAPNAGLTAMGGSYSLFGGSARSGPGQPGAYGSRRLSWAEGAPVASWGQLFSRAWQDRTVDLEAKGEVASELLRPRRLQPQSATARSLQEGLMNPSRVVCPNVQAKTEQACKTEGFEACQAKCMTCVKCIKGSSDQDDCSSSCDDCVSPGCINTLALCAGDTSCSGSEATQCEAGCGSCMACFDSNDANCQGCECCIDCLPVAAKCSGMSKQTADAQNRFVFVGVYNHRRWTSDRDLVHAVADISLKADPNFGRLPSSWIADLYNPFQDMQKYRITKGKIYPDGEQFIYELDLHTFAQTVHEQIRLYHDRVTLLIMKNEVGANMVLRFAATPNVTHVLSTSHQAPKTLFDFDTVHSQANGYMEVDARNQPVTWCAIFGGADGHLQVSATSYGEVPSAPVPIGFALVCVFGLLCALLVLGVIYGGAQKLSERFGVDPSEPISQWLANWGLVRGNQHESTASLTRAGSLSGYVGSEVIDRSVEDQYLHRGGIGDDGI